MDLYLTKPSDGLHCNNIFLVVVVVAFIADAVTIVVDTFKDYILIIKDIPPILIVMAINILAVVRIQVVRIQVVRIQVMLEVIN